VPAENKKRRSRRRRRRLRTKEQYIDG